MNNATDTFNQNENQMRDYHEARIEALKHRIHQLEQEICDLRRYLAAALGMTERTHERQTPTE
jgi:methionine synthase I (cobalamin-dependent)